jgi:cysteinyl-tRNA synthetase
VNTALDGAGIDAETRSALDQAFSDADSVLGIFPKAEIEAGDAAEIDALVAERTAARQSKDFARADAIRDKLAARGIVLEDTPHGTVWHRE